MRPAPSTAARHRTIEAPAGRLHLVEQGTGPLVLLVHGFPESWYSWRHQLPALAAAGYRAVAVDVRGYGRSSKPDATGRLPDARPGGRTTSPSCAPSARSSAVVVGHDWGANIAAISALLRPEVFRAVALLSVPYAPPGGPRPTDVFGRIGGPAQEFYVSYFQEPGRAEAEIEPDVRGWLAGFYAALSADTMPADDAPDPHFVAHGGRLRDRFPAAAPPRLADRGRSRRLRRGIRAHRHDRRTQPLPRHGPRLGGPRPIPRRTRSSSRPCSSAAPWTPPPPGCPTPSTPTPPPSPPCRPPTSWRAAVTGSSRNAPMRSTVC